MVPFFLVFGLVWLGFGLFAVTAGISDASGSNVLSGGAIAALGALLLLRAGFLRARVRRDIAKVQQGADGPSGRVPARSEAQPLTTEDQP